MKRILLLAAFSVVPALGFCLTYDSGAAGTAATVSSQTITTLNTSTLTVINNATIGSTDSGGDLTIGGGTGDSNPVLILDKDGAGSGQVIFKDAGTQRGQITLDSSEAMTIGTDSGQALIFRTNSVEQGRFDSSGNLAMYQSAASNQTPGRLTIGGSGASFVIDGSTAAPASTTPVLTSTGPMTNTGVFKWINVKICDAVGTNCTSGYMPVWK